MTKTHRALWASLLSVLLCLSMLIGTTFAWFTDSVSSGMNQIIAGNLDIDLEYSSNMSSWNPVEGAANMFKLDTLWEPGHTEVVYLRLSNKGSLDLKFKFSMNFDDVVKGQTEGGKEIVLSKFLKYDIIEVTSAFANRPDARRAVENTAVDLAGETIDGTIAANTVAPVLALVVYMPESVGNDANYRGTAAPKIELGIRVLATQLNSEEDSFDSSFDIGAEYDDPAANKPPVFNVANAHDLQLALTPSITGQEATVKLTADIELAAGETWTPLNLGSYDANAVQRIVIDGDGHTIKGLNAPLIGQAVFGSGHIEIEIKNLTLDSVTIADQVYNVGCAAFVSYADHTAGVTLTNCHLKNSSITNNTTGFSGLGGLMGYCSSPLAITDCTVTNTTIQGFDHSAGAIVGHVGGDNHYTATINNVIVTNCTITGENANKSGIMFGTAGIGRTELTANLSASTGNTVFGVANSATVYGRFSHNGIGVLIINGVEVPKN